MILLDDNFASIVRAVREGRRIYDNIRTFIKFALTTQLGRGLAVFVAPLFGMPMPLLPIQILWINLVTDGLPGLALAAEPEEKGRHAAARRAPPHESVFAGGLGSRSSGSGCSWRRCRSAPRRGRSREGAAHWQTMVFTVLRFSQLDHVLAIRSERESLFTQGVLSNKPLLATVVLTFGLQIAAIYAEPLNRVLKTAPLTPLELIVAIGVASVVFLAVEIEKWVKRTELGTDALAPRRITFRRRTHAPYESRRLRRTRSHRFERKADSRGRTARRARTHHHHHDLRHRRAHPEGRVPGGEGSHRRARARRYD